MQRPDREPLRLDGARATEFAAVMATQAARFREKFGRDMGPDDPVFFDEDADLPQPIKPAKAEADMVAAMEAAGVQPEVIYAYQHTGMVVTDANYGGWSDEDLQEFQDAVERYQRLHG